MTGWLVVVTTTLLEVAPGTEGITLTEEVTAAEILMLAVLVAHVVGALTKQTL
jgi:hypothetical protein